MKSTHQNSGKSSLSSDGAVKTLFLIAGLHMIGASVIALVYISILIARTEPICQNKDRRIQIGEKCLYYVPLEKVRYNPLIPTSSK